MRGVLFVKNLFNKKIPPSCEYCKTGKKLTEDVILCVKYGVTTKNNFCKKFKYSPLKRIPKKQNPANNFDEKDFII